MVFDNMRTDEELEEEMMALLELLLGVPLTPRSINQEEFNFHNSIVTTDYLPVYSIDDVLIDGTSMNGYISEVPAGIIHFNEPVRCKHLTIKYHYGLKTEDYLPILKLLIKYAEDLEEKGIIINANSIHEAEVSLGLSSEYTEAGIIFNMINKLKSRYHNRLGMI